MATTRHSLLRLLAAAARGRTDLELDAFDLPAIDWAVTAGLGPLLHRATSDDPSRSAHPRHERLLSTDLTARVLTGETIDAVGEVLDRAAAVGIEVTLLKGIALAGRLYPEPHLRPMADVDLLVEASAVAPFESLLTELGYRGRSPYADDFYERHHHVRPYFHPERREWIEVHRGLFPPYSPLADDPLFSPPSLLATVVPSELSGRSVRRLAPEIELVYLASHWAFELDPVGALVPMLDVLLLCAHETLDWQAVVDAAGTSTAAGHLYLLLSFLQGDVALDLPSSSFERLRRRQSNWSPLNLRLAHRLVRTYAVGGRPFDRWMTARSFDRIWEALTSGGRPLANLMSVPLRLAPDRWQPSRRRVPDG